MNIPTQYAFAQTCSIELPSVRELRVYVLVMQIFSTVKRRRGWKSRKARENIPNPQFLKTIKNQLENLFSSSSCSKFVFNLHLQQNTHTFLPHTLYLGIPSARLNPYFDSAIQPFSPQHSHTSESVQQINFSVRLLQIE